MEKDVAQALLVIVLPWAISYLIPRMKNIALQASFFKTHKGQSVEYKVKLTFKLG